MIDLGNFDYKFGFRCLIVAMKEVKNTIGEVKDA